MFRAIPARRPFASKCSITRSGSLEIQPSARAAILSLLWIVALAAMIVLAVDLPLLARIGLCICAATASAPVIRTAFLGAGPSAVRSLRWSGEALWARFGRDEVEKAVELAPGSFRIGHWLLVLRLETCDRTACVLIDGGRQQIQGFRRLCRHLESRRHAFP